MKRYIVNSPAENDASYPWDLMFVIIGVIVFVTTIIYWFLEWRKGKIVDEVLHSEPIRRVKSLKRDPPRTPPRTPKTPRTQRQPHSPSPLNTIPRSISRGSVPQRLVVPRSLSEDPDPANQVICPNCDRNVTSILINEHLDSCLRAFSDDKPFIPMAPIPKPPSHPPPPRPDTPIAMAPKHRRIRGLLGARKVKKETKTFFVLEAQREEAEKEKPQKAEREMTESEKMDPRLPHQREHPVTLPVTTENVES